MFQRLADILRLVRFPLIFIAIGDTWSVYLLAGKPRINPGSNITRELMLLACCITGLVAAGGVMAALFSPSGARLHFPGEQRPSPLSRATAWIVGAGALGLAVAAGQALGRGPLILVLVLALLGLVSATVGPRWPSGQSLLRGVIHAVHAQLSVRFSPLGLWSSAWLLSHHCLLDALRGRLAGRKSAPSWGGIFGLACLVPLLSLAWVACGQTLLLDVDDATYVDLTAPLVAVGTLAIMAVWVVFSPRLGSPDTRADILGAFGLGWTLVYHMAFQSAAGNLLGILVMLFLLALAATAAQLLVAISRLSPPLPGTPNP